MSIEFDMVTTLRTTVEVHKWMLSNGVHMHRQTMGERGYVQWYFVVGKRVPYNKKCATSDDPVIERRECIYVKVRRGG